MRTIGSGLLSFNLVAFRDFVGLTKLFVDEDVPLMRGRGGCFREK